MSELKKPLVSHFEPPHASLNAYVIGFVTSLALTGAAYWAAISDGLSSRIAIGSIAVLAVLQCVVQLRQFLHLGDEFKPRWKVIMFFTMLSILLILVIGSVWIMTNLNYRMVHSPGEMVEYVESQDGL
ncbi:MAG TPA: cytochrome o ubiquinol/quinol oxidase subunit IV [Candidatus Saccharimonadales bacterium]